MNNLPAHLPPDVGQYTGTLLRRAEARTALIDGEGHCVPVVCLDIELDGSLHTRLHAEQRFPQGHHDQATAAAHRLTAGTRVTVQAPLVSLRMVAGNVTHIHTHHETQPGAPT